jgi:hypothetical protein
MKIHFPTYTLLLGLACFLGCSRHSAEETKTPPQNLKIEITPAQTTYSIRKHANFNPSTFNPSTDNPNAFLVHYRITNLATNPCSFQVMSCSYFDSWKTDNKDVGVHSWYCDGNAPFWVTLTSTNADTGSLPLFIDPTAKGTDVTFRMAFTPGTSFNTNRVYKTFWSNPITVKVTD